MNPQQLMSGLIKKNKELSELNQELLKLATNKAEAEKKYRISRAEETLRLKNEGNPTTLIKDIVKGEVAQEKLDFDLATEIYKIKIHKVWDIRGAIDTYRSLLTWERMEYKNANVHDESGIQQ